MQKRTTGIHVELDPPAARPTPLCSIHGTDKPFDDSGCENSLTVASDARAEKPMVVYKPHGVDVTFDLTKERGPAGVTVIAGGVKVTGFSDISTVPFHLSEEATAFKGHAHLLAGDSVNIIRATDQGVIVRADRDSFNIEEMDAEATCGAVLFDGFTGSPTVPKMPAGRTMLTRWNILRLKGGPGEAAFFALRVSESTPPLTVMRHEVKGNDAHITFSTKKARFDAWVDEGALVDPDGGFGTGGIGIGKCRQTRQSREANFQVVDDTDVLVSDKPGKRGPTGVRLTRGILVVATEAQNGWAEISIEPPIVAPAPGLHFFLPWDALRDIDAPAN